MMSINSKLKRNIKISYIYNFMMQFNITTAVWVLYLSYKGMSLVEIGLLEAIFHITGLFFELPTGAIADIYGKRFSIIAGRILSIVATILMIVSNSFWQFALAFVITAASYNMESGAGEALVYDSLKELGEEERYKRIWGSLSFLMSISQGFAILLGGILADVKFLYAYILGAILQLIALIISLGYTEPPVEKVKSEENAVISQLRISVTVLREKRLVGYLILLFAVISSLGATVFFYSQKYFEDISYTKTEIALIFAVSSLLSALSSKYAHKLEKRLKPGGIMILIALLNVCALFGLCFIGRFSITFFLVCSATEGLSYPIFSDYINSRIPSEYRATLLSVNSLCYSLFMICVFPLFGMMAEKLGFSNTFGIIGVMYIPIMLILLLKIKSYWFGGKIK